MSNVPEKISSIQSELEELRARKDRIVTQLNDVESDINNADADDHGNLIRQKRELEEELTNINEAITANEEQISRLRGDDETENDLSDVVEEADSLITQLEGEYENVQHKIELINERIEQIDDKQEDLDELEDTARGLLERSTSAALGKQFADRKSELEENLGYWKAASALSIGILLTSAVVLYFNIINSGANPLSNVSKIALILPISVAVWFSVSNYNRQKRLMEEYEFKARMALSLTGFREVLEEETGEENNEMIVEFIIDTMDKIYSNPQENIQDEAANNQDTPLTNGQTPLVEVIRKLGK
ncbi:hypothetical protein [Haloarcula amylolytica]|uniref:hypothetical protein n=1 Tax=Haloarcula amylolytica TaxID=396317 RepID=UPI003C75B162